MLPFYEWARDQFDNILRKTDELYKNCNILSGNNKESFKDRTNLRELLIRHMELTSKSSQKLEELEKIVKSLRERLGDFD